ncbi:MAG TPA: tetratricopeptide repeat protein [Steroidobacteraceae bacterium]|nr:tetratricopeptide repeat protein [Steroidobacteraceae bacterium]
MGRTVLSNRIVRRVGCMVALFLATTSVALPDAKAPDMAAVGAELTTIFNERKADTLAGMLDMNALGMRVAENVYESERGRSDFVRGFTKTAQSSVLVKDFMALLDRSPESSAKFMKVVTRGAETRPLLRFDYGDSGFEYIEFVVKPDGKGGVRIVDWAPLSGGELYSQVIGRMSRILSDPAPGLIQTLLGMPKIDQESLKRMKAIAEMRRKGDLRGAYLEMEKLPAAISDSRVMLVQRASLASEAGDDANYRKMLARLEQLHGNDPAAAFMLLDHYFFAKDLDKCLRAITTIESRVGVDGMTQMLRSNIYMSMGKHQEAITYSRKAIEIEPDMTDPYFTLAQSHVSLGQFAEAIEVYSTLRDEFGYQFTKENFAQDPTFAKFVASPPFKKWLAQ